MFVAWHRRRWCKFGMPEDEKKEVEAIFTDQCFYHASIVQKY